MMISLDPDGPEHDISNEFLMNLAIRTSILVSISTNFMMISLDLDGPEHDISMNFLWILLSEPVFWYQILQIS